MGGGGKIIGEGGWGNNGTGKRERGNN